MKAWVTSLEDYNNGRLIGVWLDLSYMFMDEVEEFLQGRRAATGTLHEEWGAFDYEDVDSSIREWLGGEHPDAARIEEAGSWTESDAEVFAAALSCFGAHYVESVDWARDRFSGCADSLADWARDLYEDGGELKDVPEIIRQNIDWEGVAQWLVNEGYCYSEVGRQVYVFSNGRVPESSRSPGALLQCPLRPLETSREQREHVSLLCRGCGMVGRRDARGRPCEA